MAGLLLVVLFIFNEVDLSGLTSSSPDPDLESLTNPPPFKRVPPTSAKEGAFTRLDGCILIPDERANDGDSFHLRHGKESYHFRLYFVDAPEKYRHRYNGERLAEQGEYFGISREEDTLAMGRAARDLTLKILERARFSVWTRWERVYGSDRYYALIEIQNPGEGAVLLHEILVRQGLARIHTKGIDLPSSRPWQAQKKALRNLEERAKSAAAGAWKKR
ncbi:MAG: thermonuclease family protein [Verrucomicrobiota bacterium]